MTTEARLNFIFRDVFKESAHPERLLRGQGPWDSMKHIELITAVEEEFVLNIPIEAVISIQNFEELLVFIQNSGPH